jgi:hypothetical protein
MHGPIRGRLAELLAGEATEHIGPDEQAELERLLAQGPSTGRDEMMRVAGLVQLAHLRHDAAGHRVMPVAVRERLSRQAAAWSAARQDGEQLV